MDLTRALPILHSMKSFRLQRRAETTSCPFCGFQGAIPGRLLGQLDLGMGFVFRPTGGRRFALLGRDVSVSDDFYACPTCGHLWATVSPSKLRRAMPASGSEHSAS